MKLYLRMRKKLFFIFSLCFLFQNNGISNSCLLIPPDTLNKKRLILVSSSKTALASTSFIVLNELWYSKYPKTKFHTFNDSKEWLQMDKIGHATTSYYLGYLSYEIFKWTGLENKKAILYGGATSLIYMSALEFMDGFYNEWGFSIADMSSNLIGTGLVSSMLLALKSAESPIIQTAITQELANPSVDTKVFDNVISGLSVKTLAIEVGDAQTARVLFEISDFGGFSITTKLESTIAGATSRFELKDLEMKL